MNICEAVSDRIYARRPYPARSQRATRNDGDPLFPVVDYRYWAGS